MANFNYAPWADQFNFSGALLAALVKAQQERKAEEEKQAGIKAYQDFSRQVMPMQIPVTQSGPMPSLSDPNALRQPLPTVNVGQPVRQFDENIPLPQLVMMAGEAVQKGADVNLVNPLINTMKEQRLANQRNLEFKTANPGDSYGYFDSKTGRFVQTGQVPPKEGGDGPPTQLTKAFAERDAIARANPNDPRLAQYDEYIKKIQQGVTSYQLSPTGPGGENLIFNPKTGRFEGGTGTYKQPTDEIKKSKMEMNNTLSTLDEIDKIANKESMTGSITGNAKKIGNKFFNDKSAAKFIATLGQLRTIIYGLSGKQINEQEMDWLNNEILPKITQPDENFNAYVEVLRGWMNRRIKSLDESFPALKSGESTGEKRPEDMSDEEIDAELKRLMGK